MKKVCTALLFEKIREYIWIIPVCFKGRFVIETFRSLVQDVKTLGSENSVEVQGNSSMKDYQTICSLGYGDNF